MRFKDKVAIIAGASEGIGRATAVLMAAEGAIVVPVARNAANLASLAKEIADAGGRCQVFVADCLDEAAVADVVAKVMAAYGRIDILVNSIGGSTIVANPIGDVSDTSLADFEKMLQFNLVPTFLTCKHVGPVMKAQGSGKIVNMSSLAARGHGSISSYSAAKAGVISFTTKLARELGPFGINCNAIAPGLVLTERINRTIGSGDTPEARAERVKNIPMRRHSMPEDQARVVAFLASDDAAMVTGSTLDVAGGA